MTRHEAREDGLRTRVDGAQQQAQQADSDCISDQIWCQPCQKLKSYGAESEDDDKSLLAYSGRSVSEYKTAKRDASLFGN